MDLLQLKYFIAVAETLNFTRAASLYGVSQSSVSRQIVDLEKQLNTALFVRNNKEVALTNEGVSFLPYAQKMVEAANDGIMTLSKMVEKASALLFIETVANAGVFLSKCLKEFSSKHPEITIEISHISAAERVLSSKDKNTDFYFVESDRISDKSGFEYIETEIDSLALIMPKNHRLSDKPVNFDELKEENFLMLSPLENPLIYSKIEKICKANRFSPNVTVKFDRMKSLWLAVASGLGVAIAPASIANEFFSDKIDVVPLNDKEAKISCAVAWNPKNDSAPFSLFLDVIKNEAQKIANTSEQSDK